MGTALCSILAFVFIRKDITKRKKQLGLLLAVLATTSFLYPLIYKQFQIDACLDAGGKWK